MPVVSALLYNLPIVPILTLLLGLSSPVVVMVPHSQDKYSNPREVACRLLEATVNSVALGPNEVQVE
jgi:hypothetical protein